MHPFILKQASRCYIYIGYKGKLKRGKAPGADGIQNEAWRYGEEKVILELTAVLNRIWHGGGGVPNRMESRNDNAAI